MSTGREFGIECAFLYIGTAPCGCTTGITFDDPKDAPGTAKFVAKMIRRGDSIARVRRTVKAATFVRCREHADGTE